MYHKNYGKMWIYARNHPNFHLPWTMKHCCSAIDFLFYIKAEKTFWKQIWWAGGETQNMTPIQACVTTELGIDAKKNYP